ncbi:MAG TPA: hypothetical protein VFW98_05660 [Gemmatimonadaceae bacterium]|nr:hypothetical protein [Gemmatimonadaceae bacterium]
MTIPTSERALARRLLAREAPEGDLASDASVAATAAEQVFQRLRSHLVTWIGPEGFRALLTRAIDRARSEHPLLAGLPPRAESERPLDGLVDHLRATEATEAAEAMTVLVATFIVLLARFIGNGLAARLVEQSWPVTPDANSRSDEGNKPHG